MGRSYGARFSPLSSSSSPDGGYLLQRKLVDALDFPKPFAHPERSRAVTNVLRLLARNALPHTHDTRRPVAVSPSNSVAHHLLARDRRQRLWSPLETSPSLRRAQP